MRNLALSPLILAFIIVNIIFWSVWWFVPVKLAFDVLNAVVVSVGVGVLIAYVPGIFTAFSRDRRDLTTGRILILGIIATWVATNARSVWNWAWRFYGKPPDMLDHPTVAYLLVILILGGVLHLTARDAIDGRVPTRTWRNVGLIIAAGLAVGGIFFVSVEQ